MENFLYACKHVVLPPGQLFQQPPAGARKNEAPLTVLVPTLVLTGATLFFGFSTDLTAGVADAAARQLLGATP